MDCIFLPISSTYPEPYFSSGRHVQYELSIIYIIDNAWQFTMERDSRFSRCRGRRQLGIDCLLYGYLFEHCVRTNRNEWNRGDYLVYTFSQKEGLSDLWTFLN